VLGQREGGGVEGIGQINRFVHGGCRCPGRVIKIGVKKHMAYRRIRASGEEKRTLGDGSFVDLKN